MSLLLCAVAWAANPAGWWGDIANDRAPQVKTMLAQGADPNELSAKGQPAIMQAIRDGAWNVYDVLAADRKTVINAININRETPLMYLAVVGETKRAKALIDRGAQVNRLGWTPLHYAASKGQLEMAKMLIAHKALVNAPSPDGTTPLMMAAYAGSEPVVRLLLDAGAEITTQNLQKQNAADWARLKKHDTLAKQLDGAIEQTLDQRAAAHAKNRAQETGTHGAASVEGSAANNGRPSAVQPTDRHGPDGSAGQGSGANNALSGSQSTPPSEEKGSGSRYFDLNRFEQKAPQ